jgi:hypothetical protein
VLVDGTVTLALGAGLAAVGLADGDADADADADALTDAEAEAVTLGEGVGDAAPLGVGAVGEPHPDPLVSSPYVPAKEVSTAPDTVLHRCVRSQAVNTTCWPLEKMLRVQGTISVRVFCELAACRSFT